MDWASITGDVIRMKSIPSGLFRSNVAIPFVATKSSKERIHPEARLNMNPTRTRSRVFQSSFSDRYLEINLVIAELIPQFVKRKKKRSWSQAYNIKTII